MTPHNNAKEGEIAKTVIMPGDSLRAKYIAETYLENAKLCSSVRNIYAYTGTYKGKEISVMASGMGMPSMGIYSYELFKFYNVENIIRIGTCGSYAKDVNILDLILVEKSYSKSVYAKILDGISDEILPSSIEINNIINEEAISKNISLHKGNILCSDVFYAKSKDYEKPEKYNCLGVEMESFALFANAKALNKNAACILTVSDVVGGNAKKELTPEERQNSLIPMIELALETGIKL